MKSDLEKLRIDKEYYTGIGKKYLSNSDIGTLLKNPKEFGKESEDNINFAKGRLFHQLILEPTKAEQTIKTAVDVSSRNAKAYKEMVLNSEKSFILLTKEVEEMKQLTSTMLSNIDFFDLIRDENNLYEEPAIRNIKGIQWKGKADIVASDYLIDLKTTADINKFKWSAREYNYDSQAFIYEFLFGKPLLFLVIDKNTGALGKFTPSEDFLARGEEKVEKAIEVYDKFFNPKKENYNINNYYIETEL
tara:strand:+ start:497 stop:1237 length:741 start_codon:yes stop_codon:yes gene_type:complete